MGCTNRVSFNKFRRLSLQGLLLLVGVLSAVLLSGCGQSTQPEATPTPLPYESPDWFKNAVLYEIFVRSYADSDGDGIGDLNGITQKLDYIEALGVDAIWLMPIYPSPSYHGYDVTDFFAVNPDYGTIEDLQALVNAAHQRDLRVILDFVPSHLSNQNPLFEQAYGNPEAENVDWFVFTNKTNTQYAGFANSKEMPRFNHFNPEVVDYLTEAALFWLDLDGDGNYSDGVDGFRIDNATFPPQEFFIHLRQKIKTNAPDALLLGETWVADTRGLSMFYENQFDALFDFPMYSTVQGSQNSNGDGLLSGRGSPILLNSLLKEEAQRYPEEALTVRFLSNHDTNRIASEVKGDLHRQKLAATLLASLPGPVMVYYGEEIGMLGQKGTSPWWDAYRREPMDWYTAETGPDHAFWFMEEDRWNAPDDGISVEEQDTDPNSLLNHYRHLLSLRAEIPALHAGELGYPDTSSTVGGGWAITRTADSQTILAVFNFSTQENTITITESPFNSENVIDLVSGESYGRMQAGQTFSITLPPAGAVILIEN